MEDEGDDLEETILRILHKWGYRGVTRETFYNSIHGLNYEDLKVVLVSLEEGDFIEIEWTGLDSFLAEITESGVEHLKSLGSESVTTEAPKTASFEKTKALTYTKCKICMGSIKESMDIIKCSCGREYHATCGERFGKCPDCDIIFSDAEAK
ncbi:MAG: hypothetical protein KAX31_00835 [Thermoplasmata archaeon]|nr:hypothetical protein [Thermoplasmata archaeon]